jgi:hypothetical protein
MKTRLSSWDPATLETVMDDVLGYAGCHVVVTGAGALQTGQVDLSTLFATQR